MSKIKEILNLDDSAPRSEVVTSRLTPNNRHYLDLVKDVYGYNSSDLLEMAIRSILAAADQVIDNDKARLN